MSKSSAYIGFSALWNPDPISGQRLKISTLLFDEIRFETPIKKNLVDYAIKITGSDEDIKPVTQRDLEKIWLHRNEANPQFDIYGEDGKWPWDNQDENLKQATLTELSSASAQELDLSNYEQYKLGGYSMSEILYWQKYYSDSVYIGSDIVDNIIRKMATNMMAQDRPTSEELVCPDLFNISWDDINELRKSDFLVSFRKKYNELTEKKEVQFLMEHYQKGLSGILDEVRPNPKKEILKAVLVNVPGLFVNPLSVVSSAADVYKGFQMRNKYGWLFFIKDALRLKSKNT